MTPAVEQFRGELMRRGETLGRLLTAWQSVFGRTQAMVRDAVKQASAFHDEHVDLREVLHDIADERGEINRRRLGWWIKRHAGRVVDGRRFVRASGNRSAEAWQVESVFAGFVGLECTRLEKCQRHCGQRQRRCTRQSRRLTDVTEPING